MSDFCRDCSLLEFGEDFRELANISKQADTDLGLFAFVLCEGCGPIYVDHTGTRVDFHTWLEVGEPEAIPVNEDLLLAHKDGMVLKGKLRKLEDFYIWGVKGITYDFDEITHWMRLHKHPREHQVNASTIIENLHEKISTLEAQLKKGTTGLLYINEVLQLLYINEVLQKKKSSDESIVEALPEYIQAVLKDMGV